MTQEPQQHASATRRGVLLGVGVAGIGALAGCSTAAVPYDSNEAGVMPHDEATVATAPSASAMPSAMSSAGSGAMAAGTPGGTSTSTSASGAGAMNTGTLLGYTSEIPVGGGKVFTAEKVVVTQPVKDEYLAFSAVCTHVGCIVDKVSGGEIFCPCHGAVFKITNGAAVAGPTTVALPQKHISVEDGKISLE